MRTADLLVALSLALASVGCSSYHVTTDHDATVDVASIRTWDFMPRPAAEPGALKTDSGLVFREVSAGTGDSPKATDNVKVHYRGTLINGTVFDSSYDRNEPAVFNLSGVVRCWTEGVQRMKVGGKAHLVCPSDLAYGDQGRPTIPGGAALVFDVELLEIVSGPLPQ